MIQARNLVPAIGDYSTSEQNTGFKWINGSAIYKKTISFTTGANDGTTKTVAHGISNFSVLVKAEGRVTNNSISPQQQWIIPNGFGSSGSAAIRVDTTYMYINVWGDAQANKPGVVTLYYTKTS